jgi:phosphoglycerate dehydrogenase-like enzyme
MKIAIIDDYQNVALKMADWGSLPANIQVTVYNDHLASVDAIAKRLANFEIVIGVRERTPFRRELLERLPNLKLLGNMAMRNAAIDLDAATELGIVVCGTSAGPASATAELAWGLILSLMRQIPKEDVAIRQGRFQTTLGSVVYGKVLGVMGLGRLGSQMATVGKAFGMSVIAWSQNMTTEKASQFGAILVTKDEIFARSDILTIHLQLSDRTRGLVQARELELMKPTAYLINTSRGPIVDETALIQALQNRTIAGAGLDVFEPEPLPENHPFLHMDNTVLTPHLGYVTKETYHDWYSDTVENIKGFLAGQPVRVMNPAVLETTYRGKK